MAIWVDPNRQKILFIREQSNSDGAQGLQVIFRFGETIISLYNLYISAANHIANHVSSLHRKSGKRYSRTNKSYGFLVILLLIRLCS
jgi:hypothetical protein